MLSLNTDNLSALGAVARVPTYDRRAVAQSIVHIGVGGFHRSHQAVYLDDLLHLPDQVEWGYCGLGLLPQDRRMYEAMSAQDCLYSVIERRASSDRVRIVGSILDYVHAPADPEAALEKLASAKTRIVSLTITEGGYYVNEGTGTFNDTHPDIVHDLRNPHQPRCSFGYIAEALARRRKRGLGPFAIMSCDNLQHNGALTRRMLLSFAERRDPSLAAWIAEHGAFPSSMVDRITPVTTDEHRTLLRDGFGISDAWPVVTEPFSQWVIEDQFPGGRPEWELVGALMTSEVAPYEEMKMRLLNAGHQAMCYIGMLLGYEFAHQAMADVRIRTLVRNMMDAEVTPLLTAPTGIDIEAYKASLIERFSNPAIQDQLARIGTEGSVRIPGFVLPSVADALARGAPVRLLAFTVAAWFRFLAGHDEQGNPLQVIDPLADILEARAVQGGPDPVALLGTREVFDAALAEHPVFVACVRHALEGFHQRGVAATLEAFAGGPSRP